MRKIIIILILTLTTFIRESIYINNVKHNNGNYAQNIEEIVDDYSTNIQSSSENNSNLSDNFQKNEENIEDEKKIEVSSDKKFVESQLEENNVIVTLYNAEEEKRIEKNTQESKIIEQPKKENNVEVLQPKEETRVIETKPELIQETESITPKCNENNHGVGVGNSNKWFNSKQEAINYYQSIIKTWGDKWEKYEIDDETYNKNCPYGYETWSCPFCEKWTINFYDN